MSRLILIYCLIGCLGVQAQNEQNHEQIVWHWENEFSESDQNKLQKWIHLTLEGVQKRIGVYPFKVHVYFHLRENATEPCPWANTWRYPTQDVHFHVDPTYSLEAFLEDWTAPHELSHLAIPYIGEKEAWFAEGFASFMQYQVMEQMGIMTQNELDSAYRYKVELVKDDYTLEKSIGAQAAAHRENNNYKSMYWGGATFFLNWNEFLKKEGKTLCEIFPAYLECCRLSKRGIDNVVEALDGVSSYNFGSNLMRAYRDKPSRNYFEFKY